jgi:flagellar biosynthetic protein FliQ
MESEAIDIARRTLEVTILLALPILGSALLVGLLVSILQAVTQINEMTLTFVPKLFVVGVVLLVLVPWMMTVLVDFSSEVFSLVGEAPRAAIGG